MIASLSLSIFFLAAPTGGVEAEAAAWTVKANAKGVTVMVRDRAGSEVKEIKAVGEVSSPPSAVFRVLSDFERYKEIMPYTEESKIIATEEGGKVVHFYSRINAPFAARRDYTIRIVDTSDFKDGKGSFGTRWTLSDKGPEPAKGVVRVAVNEGSWILEPIGDGAKCRATYVLHTDPGGSLPNWIKNSANSSAIPNVFEALRKHAPEAKYAGP